MKRRGNGEGSVFRRKDGRWCARVSLGRREDGRRRMLSFYGKTRREAAAKLGEAQHDHRRGLLPADPSGVTTGQYLEVWLRDVAEHTVRPATAISYADHLRRHVIPTLGHLPLAKLGPPHVQQLLADKRKAGASPRCTQYAHDILRSALAQAVRWRLLAVNPTDAVKRPRAERRLVQILSPEQATTLLKIADRERLHALVTLAVTSGLRQGELLGLGWKALDLDAAQVRVERQLLRTRTKGSSPMLGPLKTKHSRRTVELTASAAAVLRAHRARQAAERLALGPGWHESDLVFTTAAGRPLNPSNVRRDFRRVLERGGLPPVSFHALRHTCATLLLAAGVSPKHVQEQLGHHSVAFTLSVYGHVLPDERTTAARRLGALLAGKRVG